MTRSGAEPRRSAKPSVVKKGAATGKRKTAIARVRLVPGKGEFKINGKSLEEYFPNKVHQQIIGTPFAVTGLTGKFDVFARLNGGGASGQAGALRLGIARSLNEIDRTANRAVLKSKSLLTRDDRIVERKKAGLKKARKASQFSKR
ncbi:MAG: 30S ribosomal protein S9 [Bifidobacteriaceae bacterium]|nr:30S ribosomal protein S9 [Bifidobacteriaceae bacterium]